MRRLISSDNAESWQDSLNAVGSFDAYHTSAYHDLATDKSQEAYLFVVQQQDMMAVFPFIARKISELRWYDGKLRDAVSCYGYPGPLFSTSARNSNEFRELFVTELKRALNELDIVTLFARCHPVLSPTNTFSSLEFEVGQTVLIDLAEDLDLQRANCKKTHRYEIRRANAMGLDVQIDSDFKYLSDFVELYNSRMQSIGARQEYFFSDDYYRRLIALESDTTMLVHGWLDGNIVASAFFLVSSRGIQYHLSATKSGHEKFSPTRLLIERMREWGFEQDKAWLHLGGGVGGSEDSLFRFKAGFGAGRATFRTARVIVDQGDYEQLLETRKEFFGQEIPPNESSYFPQYRSTEIV